MAEPIITIEGLNKAIVDKVKKILSSTDYMRDVDIRISAGYSEIPTISYKISEYIIPEETDPNVARKEGDTE